MKVKIISYTILPPRGTPLILTVRTCVALKGMVFKPILSGIGYMVCLSRLEMGTVFTKNQLTLEVFLLCHKISSVDRHIAGFRKTDKQAMLQP